MLGYLATYNIKRLSALPSVSSRPAKSGCVKVGSQRQRHDYAPGLRAEGRLEDQHISATKATMSSAVVRRHPKTGLERLPTTSLLRNILMGTLFKSSTLSRIGLTVLSRVARSKSPLLNPDTNPLLRALVKPLVYDQFCAGTNRSEICATRELIRQTGYSGIILCYGKEIQISTTNELHTTGSSDSDQGLEINLWRDGNLETLDMINRGDWLGIKFTGAGPAVTQAMLKNERPPQQFVDAMDMLCSKAQKQGCRIWIDAEQQVLQASIDRWTVDLMRRYNKSGEALVYNTVQAYLKASRLKLKQQLSTARQEGWTLAIKLVRGAYIANDDRSLIHDTKKETDESYDSIVRDILSGSEDLSFSSGKKQQTQLFLAGHNPDSVAKAMGLIQSLSEQGRLNVLPDFGQLQGMADELGCKTLQRCDDLEQQQQAVVPRIYKCLTWGSIQECMQYLLRRLVENSGGADRLRDGLSAYWAELRRRSILTLKWQQI